MCNEVWNVVMHHSQKLEFSPRNVAQHFTCTHTHILYILAPGDYGDLNNFHLGPFNNDVRQLSFNVPIANDNIAEDAEIFSTRLTLDPADQARLGNRVRVSPDVASVTINDTDGKHT